MSQTNTPIENQLQKLETHLKEENDFLADFIPICRNLDHLAYRLGLLNADEQSYVTRISWWPIISILGTYSAGKSSFINHYLGQTLQRTGTQAVDDKFTVICYSNDPTSTVLPGVALDADDRFPFYEISHEVAKRVDSTETRVEAMLQMKTGSSQLLRGKVLVDSPGFDADDQRTATLRNITRHIIDLSDLVLVFFDAHHAEPGAMRDTLTYLVKATIDRPDSSKFLYILNQMDVTAREDNPEEVVAAWQRSLAQAGLTAGRFYRIYNPDVCPPIADPQVKERFEKKCLTDLKDIHQRMNQVGIDRFYRLTGMLEHTAKEIEDKIVPTLQELIRRWKTRVVWTEMGLLAVLAAAVGTWFSVTGTGLDLWAKFQNLSSPAQWTTLGVVVFLALLLHLKISRKAARSVLKQFKRKKEIPDDYTRDCVIRAFRKNTCMMRSLFVWLIQEPKGWCQRSRQRLHGVLNDINSYVQASNNRLTNPSGEKTKAKPVSTTQQTPPPHVAAG